MKSMGILLKICRLAQYFSHNSYSPLMFFKSYHKYSLLFDVLVCCCRSVSFIQEALKCTVDLLDILGMYLVITKLLGRSEMKVMVTAVGESL